MIKLLNILREIIINEKIVKVPQEVLDNAKDAYDFISKNIENIKFNSPKDFKRPYIHPKFKDYFKLKDLKNQDLKISIGFYNNSNDGASARMDTQNDVLLLNLDKPIDLEDFEDNIEHELVHAMDPKLRDQRLFGKMYTKKGAEPTGSTFKGSLDKNSPGKIYKSEFEKNWEKYLKSPWEFDAFTTPLINKISTNIKKSPDFKKILIQFLSDINSKNIEDIINDDKYEKMPWFFSKKEWKKENYPAIENEYKSELYKIKTWSTKPTLYKRFLKRISAEL